jgi:hypothetical protein
MVPSCDLLAGAPAVQEAARNESRRSGKLRPRLRKETRGKISSGLRAENVESGIGGDGSETDGQKHARAILSKEETEDEIRVRVIKGHGADAEIEDVKEYFFTDKKVFEVFDNQLFNTYSHELFPVYKSNGLAKSSIRLSPAHLAIIHRNDQLIKILISKMKEDKELCEQMMLCRSKGHEKSGADGAKTTNTIVCQGVPILHLVLTYHKTMLAQMVQLAVDHNILLEVLEVQDHIGVNLLHLAAMEMTPNYIE